ncbi:MAG: hypothetical protein IPM82_26495 [Saprospiraceae bacterium]|nr:hypothetical protein [Saprospiraceae bacterium]
MMDEASLPKLISPIFRMGVVAFGFTTMVPLLVSPEIGDAVVAALNGDIAGRIEDAWFWNAIDALYRQGPPVLTKLQLPHHFEMAFIHFESRFSCICVN